MNKKIAIIGGGNLGTAIAEGLIQSGFVQPKHILITKRNIRTLNELERSGVLVSDKNEEAVRYADLVILAVKPYQVNDILRTLKDEFKAEYACARVGGDGGFDRSDRGAGWYEDTGSPCDAQYGDCDPGKYDLCGGEERERG
jgi:2-polyprenyl-6-methoxyphenol hydroxylase-like FAD-dependent oxidoreductase